MIVTARHFDREHQREYSITVTATDWAEEPLIGLCQLTVQILDQNDNSPKFENLRYECKYCMYIYVSSKTGSKAQEKTPNQIVNKHLYKKGIPACHHLT